MSRPRNLNSASEMPGPSELAPVRKWDWRKSLSGGARSLWMIAGLLVIAVLVVYGRTRSFGFVNFDDNLYFVSNPHVRTGLSWNNFTWAFQAGYASNWHPITWLSLMLEAQCFGIGPATPHLVNVILHAINAVLLLFLLKQLTGAVWRSAIVAVLFAVHPLHVESVAWVSEHKDVLSGIFFMLTLICYTRYAKNQSRVEGRSALTPALSHGMGEGARSERVSLDPRRSTLDRLSFPLALLFFALGLMSKPMLVTVPFVLLLLDYWPLGRISSIAFPGSAKRGLGSTAGKPPLNRKPEIRLSRLLIEKLPFFLMSAATCVVTMHAQQDSVKAGAVLTFGLRAGNALVAYVTYIMQMIWPTHLTVFYPFNAALPLWEIVGAGLLLALISCGVVLQIKRAPYLAVGWFWYLGTLVPVIGFIQVGFQAHADRYAYLTQIGLYVAAVWGLDAWTRSRAQWRRLLGPTVAVILVLFMMVSRSQTAYWRDSEALWKRALACAPGSFVAYNNMGAVFMDEGRYDDAMACFQKALELSPNNGGIYNDWGKSLIGQGRTTEAIAKLETAIRLDPTCAEAHNNLANLLADTGRPAEAIEHYQKAIDLAPDRAEIHGNLANVLSAQGKTSEAIAHYRKALELQPDYAKARYNYAKLLDQVGDADAAMEQFRKALQDRPDYFDALNNLGATLLAKGRPDEALGYLRQAVRLNPASAEAHNNLGSALAAQGEASQAAKEFRKAIELKPDHAKAHFNLANVFAAEGELVAAITHYEQAVKLMPDSSHARYQLGVALQRRGQFAEAVGRFQEVLRLDPHNAPAQNNLAWLLATCPEASLRDGRRAVELALQTNQASDGNSPEILDTLAAAYAESGSFAEAIKTAKRAIELSTARKDQFLADGIRGRLKLYESNLPYHEAP